MPREIQIYISPEDYQSEEYLLQEIANTSGIPKEILQYRIERKSIDARKKPVKFLLKILVWNKEEIISEEKFQFKGKNVSKEKEVYIAGSGPAGLFAALRLIQRGLKPIVLERGKNVRERRFDLAKINRDLLINPESNYCFGEGGAGTYSDGKLYTRSTKRGNVKEILETLVTHGADKQILIEAHPHIGTNKLPQLITKIRETILDHGGMVLFNSKLSDLHYENGKLTGITVNENEKITTDNLILATGHSARDIYYLLHHKKIALENKPFAIGVRAEHPQELIDQIQYKCKSRGEYLPPASYSLVEQVKGLGVYSFCMCPGGIIAPCATSQEEIVTNGWSPSKRNNPFANSGIVVTIDEKDLAAYQEYGALAGLKFQENIERDAWIAGGKTQVAPAQRMVDFCNQKISKDLPLCSYQPGLKSSLLSELLPPSITERLQIAFKLFGKKMNGYYTNDAILVAPESRTSSPLRIPRDKDHLQHPQVAGLFPCGEGAGYAGGIVSAAIDGINCANQVKL